MVTGGIFRLITHDAAADIRLMSKKFRRLYDVTRTPSRDYHVIHLLINRYSMKDILFDHYQMTYISCIKKSQRYNAHFNHHKDYHIINYKTLHSTS